jgi:hypothetical protein
MRVWISRSPTTGGTGTRHVSGARSAANPCMANPVSLNRKASFASCVSNRCARPVNGTEATHTLSPPLVLARHSSCVSHQFSGLPPNWKTTFVTTTCPSIPRTLTHCHTNRHTHAHTIIHIITHTHTITHIRTYIHTANHCVCLWKTRWSPSHGARAQC